MRQLIIEKSGCRESQGWSRDSSTLSTKSTPSTYPEIAVNAILVLIAVAYSLLDRQLTSSCCRRACPDWAPGSFPFFLDIYNNCSMMLLLGKSGAVPFSCPAKLIEFFSSGFGKAEIAGGFAQANAKVCSLTTEYLEMESALLMPEVCLPGTV